MVLMLQDLTFLDGPVIVSTGSMPLVENIKHKGRLPSPYVFFRLITTVGLLSSFGETEAQRFYVGGGNQFIFSLYQYKLTYQNYPSFFTSRGRLSSELPTNFGYHLGYQFKEKHFVELCYSRQDYAFFPDFIEFGTGGITLQEQAMNIGFKYKYSFLSFPLRVIDFTTKQPFRLMAIGGGVYRLNSHQQTTNSFASWFRSRISPLPQSFISCKLHLDFWFWARFFDHHLYRFH